MKKAEFLKKSKARLSPEELDKLLAEKNVIELEDGGFICYEICMDNTVVIHHLYAPGRWQEIASDVEKLFKGWKILFVTKRNPRAWQKLGWNRITCIGNLMEIDLRGKSNG